MASEDVIELGSSDDEPEPAPKKMKPFPNAMVHIPTKFHGVTIKPSKPMLPLQKNFPGKSITVSKLPKVSNPRSIRTKINGIPVQKYSGGKSAIRKELLNPIPIHSKPSINPMNIIKKLNTSQVMINKLPNQSHWVKNPVMPKQKAINLPPSITITRTAPNLQKKCNQIPNTAGVKRKKQTHKKPIGEVLTVELDDDEGSPSSNIGPQWYLRPEEETAVDTSLEKANNKEPEPTKFIEITIEDSPIKPAQSKRACEIGAELAITIDDSPIKTVAEKTNTPSGSDDDKDIPKVPHSKKKLEYPRVCEFSTETVEIEIEPIQQDNLNKLDDGEKNKKEDSILINEVVEIQDSPMKIAQNELHKVDEMKCTENIKKMEVDDTNNTIGDGEFHPIYLSFIDLCFKLENSDDMKKIVDKKIKAYYRQVPKEYTESEEFIEMVSSKIAAMKAGPDKMYLYIKDIVDELNLQRKIVKSQLVTKDQKSLETERYLYGEDSEYDSKRQRQIRKLEKTLKKLHRAIQKLEEQEVDFDDDEDSVYLLTERYKERMVRVHAKFCQLTNTKMPSEPRVHIEARPGQPTGPAKRLEKWINRKVPIGTPLPFPDFHDVLRCVREANEEDKLEWNEVDIMDEARDLFTRCGKKLQRRRQENEWRIAASRITQDTDPAEKSEDLKRKLEENKQLASKKETEVFNKYADRQNLLKLEAEEIGDKEAEESPDESEDDELNDGSTSLENKEKRKERLKRLLEEKSKKNRTIKKENQLKDQSEDNKMDDVVEENKENSANVEALKNNKEDSVSQEDNKMEIDPVTQKTSAINDEKESINDDKIHSLSEDSNKVESDIDELHLLQKLHSGDEINSSTTEASESDSPIAISDTLESSSDIENKKKFTSDVISIENSTYSESESRDNHDLINNEDKLITGDIQFVEKMDVDHVEVECSVPDSKEKASINDTESIENALLASSDDEANATKDSPKDNSECVNSHNDIEAISETVTKEVVDTDNIDQNNTNVETTEKEDYKTTKTDCMEINIDTSSNENSREVEAVKTADILQIENEENGDKDTVENSENSVTESKGQGEVQNKLPTKENNESIQCEDNRVCSVNQTL